jgi:hypothetical protein
MTWILIVIIIGTICYFVFKSKEQNPPGDINLDFPPSWRSIFDQKVLFYHNLLSVEQKCFEKDVNRFLKKVKYPV